MGATLRRADEVFEKGVAALLARLDANDLLYAVESSFDYDPGPDLEKIRAPLLAVNSADDEIARRLEAEADPTNVRLVTSDRWLADRGRLTGATVEPADSFRTQLESSD